MINLKGGSSQLNVPKVFSYRAIQKTARLFLSNLHKFSIEGWFWAPNLL